jgi:hypothetical protein
MLRIRRRPATDDSGGNSPTRGWQPRQIIEDSEGLIADPRPPN